MKTQSMKPLMRSVPSAIVPSCGVARSVFVLSALTMVLAGFLACSDDPVGFASSSGTPLNSSSSTSSSASSSGAPNASSSGSNDGGADVAPADADVDAGPDGSSSSSSGAPEIPTYFVGGTIVGLEGEGLVLTARDGEALEIQKAAKRFTFANKLETGALYSVSVGHQPKKPEQRCVLENETGSVAGADVTAVKVTCETQSYRIGVKVVGLTQPGLTLLNNGGDQLSLVPAMPVATPPDTVSGFFALPVRSGGGYIVNIATQPNGQTCSIQGEAGAVTNADIESIVVNCDANRYTLSGGVGGLLGTGLALEDEAGEMVNVTSESFAFAATRITGESYTVKIKSQPSSPSQICSLQNASGVVGAVDVTNIFASCITRAFALSGGVTGLATGNSLTLLEDGSGITLQSTENGPFKLPGTLLSGAPYEVKATVSGPISQDCIVVRGTGVVSDAAVENVSVACTTRSLRVGGSVTGLSGDGLTLQAKDGELLPVAKGETRFAFSGRILSGSPYEVRVLREPANVTQVCTVTRAAGTTAGQDISNVAIACTTQKFSVNVRVHGLTQAGLVLRNNGADDAPVAPAGGTDIFSAFQAIPSGNNYNIAIGTQPNAQTCRIEGETGTVTQADVSSVLVNCELNHYLIGGKVAGLAGKGLVLEDDLGSMVAVTAGEFSLPTTRTIGQAYNVQVKAQPTSPTQICSITNNAGVTAATDVSDIAVTCVTQRYRLGGVVSGLAPGNTIDLSDTKASSLNKATLTSSGSFQLPNTIASGAAYGIGAAVRGPIAQNCSVSGGSGTVGSADETATAVQCTTRTFAVSAKVSGMSPGRTISLSNNGTILVVGTDGTVRFPAAADSGTAYAVGKIGGQYKCTVTGGSNGNGSGVLAASDVEVAVKCDSNVFGVDTLSPAKTFVGPVQAAHALAGFAFTSDGSYWIASRNAAPSVARMSSVFSFETTFGINNLRSLFAVGPTLYGRREGSNEIVRALDLAPATRVHATLQAAPANLPVALNQSADVLLANDKGVIRFWRFVDGVKQPRTTNLQGWNGKVDDVGACAATLASSRGYVLTYAGGVLRAWGENSGGLVGKITLVGAGTADDSCSGLSFVNGLLWVPNGAGASGWNGYDLGLQ
jgi:hypothetical protein